MFARDRIRLGLGRTLRARGVVDVPPRVGLHRVSQTLVIVTSSVS